MKKIFLTTVLAISIFAAYAQSFTLKGTVVDENNKPITGLTVKVEGLRGNQTLTDSNGKFELSLPDTTKSYTIVLWATGYMMQEYRINKNNNDIQIVMIKDDAKPKKGERLGTVTAVPSDTTGTGRIVGTVKDKLTEEPIPFANVAVMTLGGEVVTGGQTDSNGKYTIKAIAPDTYTLRISCIGYYTQELKGIKVGADKTVPQHFKLTPIQR